MARWNWLFAFVIVVGCGSSSSPPLVPSEDAGDSGSDAGAPDGMGARYGDSPCAECVETACQTSVTACSGDPGCASYLGCLDACPLDPSGNVDATCEAGCPRGATSESGRAIALFTSCRLSGPGASCAACGFHPPDAGGDSSFLGQSCTQTTNTNLCQECEENNCCETRAACRANPECGALLNCQIACEDNPASPANCAEQCFEQHMAGAETYGRRLVCATVKCPAATTCGPLDRCTTCGIEQCLDTFVACRSHGDCQTFEACAKACSDDTCRTACADRHPTGFALATDFASCLTQKCQACL